MFDLIWYSIHMGEYEQHTSAKGNQSDQVSELKPLFDLGHIVGTPGALQALQEAERKPYEFLHRYVTGDWGDLDEEDKEENVLSVEQGFPEIFSLQIRIR